MTTTTFSYTGVEQTFVVPAGVTSIDCDVQGAAGTTATTNKGGRVQATLSVTPGETLRIYVGQIGQSFAAAFNGGVSSFGGGASDIRKGGAALADRVIVAGGAGGYAYSSGYGDGGGTTGMNGGPAATAGKGGAPTAGGAGGVDPSAAPLNGSAGSLGSGGLGAGTGGQGGGGGGGYFGGGGGAFVGTSYHGGGLYDNGGGGSSFAGSGTSGVTHTQGFRASDNGVVILTYSAAAGPAAVLPGSGSLAATGTVVHLVAAALGGVGTLAAAGLQSGPPAAFLAGVGALAAAGVVAKLGTAALAGAGTLAAAGASIAPVVNGSAVLAGVGMFVATPVAQPKVFAGSFAIPIVTSFSPVKGRRFKAVTTFALTTFTAASPSKTTIFPTPTSLYTQVSTAVFFSAALTKLVPPGPPPTGFVLIRRISATYPNPILNSKGRPT